MLMSSGLVELLFLVSFSAVRIWSLLILRLVVCSFAIFLSIRLLMRLVVCRMMLVNCFMKLLAIFLFDVDVFSLKVNVLFGVVTGRRFISP